MGRLMSTSGARRQAPYRQRHLRDEAGTLERIDPVVPIATRWQPERLACCYGVTCRTRNSRMAFKGSCA
jgi:hypothetical protein